MGPRLAEVFARRQGRIVVTCFASNIHRVQQVVDAAAQLGRKVSLLGRSMRKNVNIGRMLGHIDVPEGHAGGRPGDRGLPDHKLVVISPQGARRPLSALRDGTRRPSSGGSPRRRHRRLLGTPIPGNERAVNETIDRIYRLGATVFTPADVPVHAGRLCRGAETDAEPDRSRVRDACARRPQAPAAARTGRGRWSAAEVDLPGRAGCRSRSTRRAHASATPSRRA